MQPENRDEFMDEPFDVTIKEGNAICSWNGRDGRICIPLRVFRVDVERAKKALAEHDGRQAEIVRLQRGGMCG